MEIDVMEEISDELDAEYKIMEAEYKQEKAQGYKGWTNFETWRIYIWITSDPETYMQAIRCKSVVQLEGLCDSFNEEINTDEIDFSQLVVSIK